MSLQRASEWMRHRHTHHDLHEACLPEGIHIKAAMGYHPAFLAIDASKAALNASLTAQIMQGMANLLDHRIVAYVEAGAKIANLG